GPASATRIANSVSTSRPTTRRERVQLICGSSIARGVPPGRLRFIIVGDIVHRDERANHAKFQGNRPGPGAGTGEFGDGGGLGRRAKKESRGELGGGWRRQGGLARDETFSRLRSRGDEQTPQGGGRTAGEASRQGEGSAKV